MIIQCPYCRETLPSCDLPRCPFCNQFFIDDLIEADFPALDKKHCIVCGKKIFRDAKICRFCGRWLDEIDKAAGDIDPRDLV